MIDIVSALIPFLRLLITRTVNLQTDLNLPLKPRKALLLSCDTRPRYEYVIREHHQCLDGIIDRVAQAGSSNKIKSPQLIKGLNMI